MNSQRLREAIGFSRGDPAPYAALGDVHVALADLAPTTETKVATLTTALHEGYQASLRVRAGLGAGLVGTAEV